MDTGETAPDLPGLDPGAYDRWRASSIGTITEDLERRLLLELIGDVAGAEALDIGCGDGALALALAEHGAVVTGIDGSAAMVEAAQHRARRSGLDIAFHMGNAEKMPFPDERFDVVTAITILCFVDDVDPVFREIVRVLRPGGRLVIGELGKWSTWAAERRVRAWLGSRLWRRGRFRTVGELRRAAARSGLVVCEVRGAIYYPRLRAAARLLAPHDPALGRLTTFGAGFLALSAVKPTGGGPTPWGSRAGTSSTW